VFVVLVCWRNMNIASWKSLRLALAYVLSFVYFGCMIKGDTRVTFFAVSSVKTKINLHFI
jgi:hypothetical protein